MATKGVNPFAKTTDKGAKPPVGKAPAKGAKPAGKPMPPWLTKKK